MIDWLKKNSGHALLVALCTSVVSIALGVFNVYETRNISIATQSRASKLEAVAKFDASSSNVVKAGGEFILALNRNSNLAAAKQKIQTLTADQILEADKLALFFPDERALSKYLDALREFSDTAEKTNSPIEISPWLESYDKLIEARDIAEEKFYKDLKVI